MHDLKNRRNSLGHAHAVCCRWRGWTFGPSGYQDNTYCMLQACGLGQRRIEYGLTSGGGARGGVLRSQFHTGAVAVSRNGAFFDAALRRPILAIQGRPLLA